MHALLRQLKFRSEWMLSPRLRGIYNAEPDRAVLEELRWTVTSGPFAGMPYITQSCGSRLAPKIIGCYERELHTAIEKIISDDYDVIIDIGCAEGYYAVGLAKRMLVPVIAFDSNPIAHKNLRELAALNGVESLIESRNACTTDDFEEFAGQRAIVICDIEGGEAALIDPQKSPALLGFDLLVEIHDGLESNSIHDTLTGRFEKSHSIETINYQGRSAIDAKSITWITDPKFRLAAVDEQRQLGLKWLLMKRYA